MLLIARDESRSDEPVVRLEGELVGPWVDELRTLCERHLDASAALTLDLAEVRFIDRRGVALLRRLQARGVRLTRYTGFAAEQLKAHDGSGHDVA